MLKLNFTDFEVPVTADAIQIQHLLKLNCSAYLLATLQAYSNTTLVKVKYLNGTKVPQWLPNSNTTLVKVKC
mgnify:CR=1 FL=1